MMKMQVIVTGEKPSKEFIDFIKRVAKKRKKKAGQKKQIERWRNQ